ncbi:MAG: hypothetical protein GX660_25130 [Clostridiaceae bacterium]|nr:hypothetical protein [Clostridiaceae bacterium]
MKNLTLFFTGSAIARIITAIFLFVALLNLPIGYYKFLRWIVCSTAIYSLYISYNIKEKINYGVWLFGLVAILFNPIIPFYLGKTSWQVADIIVGVIFIFSTLFVREKND